MRFCCLTRIPNFVMSTLDFAEQNGKRAEYKLRNYKFINWNISHRCEMMFNDKVLAFPNKRSIMKIAQIVVNINFLLHNCHFPRLVGTQLKFNLIICECLKFDSSQNHFKLCTQLDLSLYVIFIQEMKWRNCPDSEISSG